MSIGVYAILEKENGMRYIGSSSDLELEEEKVFDRLVGGTHCNYNLQAAFDATGDVWNWIVLEYCRVTQLKQAEEKWMKRMTSHLYNAVILLGGPNE